MVFCLTVHEDSLATGSMDKTIKVWSLNEGKLSQTLYGHGKGVWCLKFITKFLLCSGSYDCTIKIWNVKDGICSRTLLSHTGPVWCLCRSENIIVSASQDKTAKVWDMNSCDLLFTLNSHKEAVFCVDIQNDLIVTGSADKTIKLWSRLNGKCLKTFIADENYAIMCVSIDKNFIACGFDHMVSVWKMDKVNDGLSVRLIQEYREHIKRVECIKLRITNGLSGEGMMASGSQDGFIKYWNIKKANSVFTFDIHRQKRVSAVYFDEVRIASAGYDYTIKVLDFNFLDNEQKNIKK